MADDKGQKPVVHTKKHIARLERERRQTQLIQYFFFGALIIVAGLLIWGYLDTNVFQMQKPVATVGDVKITRNDMIVRAKIERNGLISNYMQYQQFAQMFQMDMTSQLDQIQQQLDNSQALGQGVIDSLVDEELIRQESAKRGITVSDAEIEEAVQGAYQFYPNGSPTPTITTTPPVEPTLSDDIYQYITPSPTITMTPENTSTPAPTATSTVGPTVTGTILPSETPTATVSSTPTLSPTPSETSTPTFAPTATIDPNQPTETPLPTETPYTLDGYKTEYSKGLAYFSKFGLDEAAYREFFNTDILRKKLYDQVTADVPAVEHQIWARHILVKDEETAKAVIERLNKGEDFGALAAEVSADSGSALQGGDLGWFGKGKMVAPFEEAAFSLKVGEISQPVKSDFGYHIIQVMAVRDHPLTAEEFQQAKDTAFQTFLTGLRTEYNVVITDDWLSLVPTVPNFSTVGTEAAITQAAADRATTQP
jgi:peptidyl-prolyl cis-trans isomerase D